MHATFKPRIRQQVRLQETPKKRQHEDHIAEKDFNSLRYHNLVGKSISILQVNDNSGYESRSRQRVGEAREVSSMTRETKCRVRDAKKMRMNSSFPTLMCLCHLKNSDTGPKVQKYKVRVVLQGDVVKGYSDGCDVLGAGLVSVTKKQRPQKFWMLSRDYLDTEGHTSDAVYAYAVKMEDAPRLLKLQKSKCHDIWIPLSRKMWRKTWQIIEEPVFLLEKNLYGFSVEGLQLKETVQKGFFQRVDE